MKKTKIQQLQSSLYQLAKNDNLRFPNLYSKVYQPFVLNEAWNRVKARQGSGRIEHHVLQKVKTYGLDKLFDEIQRDLQFEAYRIRPSRQEFVDKDIALVKNRILQMAVRMIIYPIFKVGFSTNSNELRTRHDFNTTLEELRNSYNDYYYIIKAHIRSGYDSINQENLMKLVEQRISDQELLHLIRRWVTVGTIYGGGERITRYGIDQDSALSPLLVSIYYNYLDKSWDKYPITWGKWLRYNDEINILCTNEKNAVQALGFLQALLEDLELDLDITKTKIEYNQNSNKATSPPQLTQNPTIEEHIEQSVSMPTLTKLAKQAMPDSGLRSNILTQESEDILAASSEKTEEYIPAEVVTELEAGSFCGYKYQFRLYAAHSNVNYEEDNIHFHTFNITLYVHAGSSIDHNYGVEKAIQDWLEPFQGKELSKTDLFIGQATTIEGIGDTLFDPMFDLIRQLGYELVKLSISENPIRVYSVSYKKLDSNVNQIRGISLDCIPIIDLEDISEASEIDIEPEPEPIVAIKAYEADSKKNKEEEYQKEIALTLEVEEASPSETEDIRTPHKPKVYLMLFRCILGIGCFAALAMLMMYIVKDSGRYPQGSDTFCHLYRADLLLKNIRAGNWFPLYDSTWYNGIEIMRYWGPLPLYILAGLEWIIGTSILDAYVLLLGVLLMIGGCGWLLWGIRYRRIGLSVAIGLLWFFMPENMRVVILEGNLPRGVINALLPFFFYFLWRVMAEKKKNSIFPLIFVTTLITLCHLGITLMLLVTTIIFTLFHASMNHTLRSSLCALGASISGILLAGLWVVPALIGGAASGSSTNQVMKFFFESIFVSLNPLTRINGDMLSFYFGISVFLICVLGMLLGPKASKAGFITALILLLCTSKSVYELFAKLPFSQFLWMIRFIPIGLAAAMVSFLLWEQLKKWTVLLLVILLAVDCATSVQNIYFPPKYRIDNVQASLDQRADQTLITEAKGITKQRMALMDLSEYGSFAPYYITGVGEAVNYSYGAGWEGAGTASNIVRLNSSVENGWYVYLFDRAFELGNDTVLIPIDNLKEKSKGVERLIESAKVTGYYPVVNDGTSILFHKDTPEQFGVISKYQDIAIGESASGIAMIFPSFEEGSKNKIDEYTYEELCGCRNIYLSGFTYHDKAAAEELLLRLAENGVSIYIDMNRVPMDPIQKSMELFGVSAQSITLTESLPVFTYQGNTFTSLDFLYNVGDWNTVYLLGLEQVDGSCDMTNKILPFLGTAKNKNLHFIGLNVVYYVQTTRDAEIQKLTEEIFGLQETTVPKREIVPIDIQQSNNRITITSEFDQVNTTLSHIDIFHSNQPIQTVNHLITVGAGTTVIDIKYPHTEKGLAVTAIGLILAILSYIPMKKVKECDNDEEAN